MGPYTLGSNPGRDGTHVAQREAVGVALHGALRRVVELAALAVQAAASLHKELASGRAGALGVRSADGAEGRVVEAAALAKLADSGALVERAKRLPGPLRQPGRRLGRQAAVVGRPDRGGRRRRRRRARRL